MKTISINNFSGGIDDPRATVNGACTSSRHFMLGRTKLTPYRDMETESLAGGETMINQKLTDVIRYNYTGSTTQIFALGQTGLADFNPRFYQKSTVDTVTATFGLIGNGEDTTGVVIGGSLIGYKGNLYCLKTVLGSPNKTYLVKHTYGASTADVGEIGTSPDGSVAIVPQPLIHPKDNKMYLASGNVVKSFDGSSLSSAVTFSADYIITSITWSGNNILLGAVRKDNGNSFGLLWSGSTTSAELIDVIDFGSDALIVLENINDVVIGVSGVSLGGSLNVGIQNTVTIRGYNGGSAEIIKQIESVGSTGSRVYPFKGKQDNKMYFPMSAYLNGEQIHQIWSVYKNEQGEWVVTPDRKINNNTELTGTITGFSVVSDYIWVAFNNDGSFYRTNDQDVFTATSQYITTVNPNMETSDRSKKKQLKAVSLRCGSPTSASHTVTLSVSADGGAYETIYSGASSSKVRVIEEVKLANGKSFLDAREYMFKIETTGNGEVYELKYGYEIIPTLI